MLIPGTYHLPARAIFRLFLIPLLFFIIPSSSIGQQSLEATNNAGYIQALHQADAYFAQGEYLLSLQEYDKAWVQYPRQKYPEKKIEQLQKILSEPELSKELLSKVISKGDSAFLLRNYKEANAEFYLALKLDPNGVYIREKIAEIAGIYKDPENETRYRIVLIHATKNFERGRYEKSINFYRQALVMKPEEAWIKEKMVSLTSLIEKQHTGMDAYSRKIEDAESLLEQQQWTEARKAFQAAHDLKPSAILASARLVFIDHLIAVVAHRDEDYSTLLAEAGNYIKVKDYENAVILLTKAQNLSPEPKEASAKLKKISHFTLEDNSMVRNYEEAVLNADLLSLAGDWSAALIAYERCQILLANDEYVQSRVKELNTAIASNQEKSKSYLSAIARADKYFSASNYNKAMSEYKYAGMLKPAEEYPRKMIAEIQAKLSPPKQTPADSLQLANSEVIPEKITEEILPEISKPDKTEKATASVTNRTASKSMTLQKKEDIEVSAKSESKKQKPASQKPEEEIFAGKLPAKETQPLNTVKKESAPVKSSLSASDIEYSKAISFADQSYSDGNLPKALNGYKAALRYKSNDKYANDKIEKINTELKDQENNLNSYKNLIANAEKAIQQKSYNEALSFYEKAITVAPDQKYPNQQIALVKTLIGKQNAAEDKYRSIIETSDNAFAQKNYSQARKGYESALQMKPAEVYPKQKIAELNSLQDQVSRNLDLYKETIADADAAYSKKDNATAIILYTKANELCPREVYPKQKLAAIKSGEEQLASRLAQYNQTIQAADQAAESKDYLKALKEYKTALTIVPDDEYAKDRIESVNSQLEEQKVRQADYTKKITAAEKAYAIRDYPTAIDQFSAASDLAPENNYPKERMAAIQAIMSEEKEQLESRFTQFVMNADAAFDAGKYEESLNSYKSALKLKPTDNYSAKKVTELSILLKNRATEVKAAYELAIKEGDEAYKAMKYEVAVTAFTKALEVKPGEVYPGQMIARIRKLLIENSIVDVMGEAFLLTDDSERKFSFKPIKVNQRRENYLLLRARATGTAQPKLYLNYGSNGLKNGGIVLKNLGHDFPSDLVINISSQDKWFREDNNWLSVYSENGDIEISAIRISIAPGNK